MHQLLIRRNLSENAHEETQHCRKQQLKPTPEKKGGKLVKLVQTVQSLATRNIILFSWSSSLFLLSAQTPSNGKMSITNTGLDTIDLSFIWNIDQNSILLWVIFRWRQRFMFFFSPGISNYKNNTELWVTSLSSCRQSFPKNKVYTEESMAKRWRERLRFAIILFQLLVSAVTEDSPTPLLLRYMNQ